MRFFLSFVDEERMLAREVGRLLEEDGHQVFRARSNITPSVEWKEEIWKQLKSCDALVALITDNFDQSGYSNQEVGFALAKGKVVIPLRFTEKLPGFLRFLQAVPASDLTLEEAVSQTVAAVKKARRLASAQTVPPISVEADLTLEIMAKTEGRFPGNQGGAYRRVWLRPEEAGRELIPLDEESIAWLVQNLPPLLKYTTRNPRQHGLLFHVDGLIHAEVNRAGEIFYGEPVQKIDGVWLGRDVVIIKQILEFVARMYRRFGHTGTIDLELKLANVKGQALKDSLGLGPTIGYQTTALSEILIHRTLESSSRFGDNPSLILGDIAIEYCRCFGLLLTPQAAKAYVTQVLQQWNLMSRSLS